MTLLKTFLVFLLVGLASPSLAGVNADATVVIHAQPGLGYTTDSSYEGLSDLQVCGEAVDSVGVAGIVVCYAIAAFPDTLDLRLTAVSFGVSYDENEIVVADYGLSGDFELPTNSWPGSDEGTAVTWAAAVSGHLVELYWFATYSAYGNPGTFSLAPHPSQGGTLADGSTPPQLDTVLGFGVLGFGVNGYVPCPPAESTPLGGWGTILGGP